VSSHLSVVERRNAVASSGLGAAPVDPRSVLDPDRWPALVDRIRADRLEGLLSLYATDSGVATERQLDQSRELHTAAALLAVHLEQRLLEVAALFDEHAIDFRVLKGPAHAHLLYPEPALRSFGDIDLLVRGDRIGEAVRLLTELGGRRRFPELRPGYDRRFTKGVAVVLPGGDEIDLHRTLAPGPFGLALDPGELFEREQAFELGGRCLPAMDPADQLLHSCYHAALGRAEPNIVALRDVAQSVERPGLHVGTALERAVRWRGRIVVASSVALAAGMFGLAADMPIVEFAERYRPDRTETRWLATYHGSARTTANQALASMQALPGWRERGAYAVAVAIPTTRGSIPHRWRRGIRQLGSR
jgi:hypothetical protein